MRVATWSADLGRFGPGLLLGDLRRDSHPQIDAVVEVLLRLDADVILLTDFDYDARGEAMAALAARLAARGMDYPHRLALRPNGGVATGLDLNGDGVTGGPDDAQGHGDFAGAEGMALFSRLPVDEGESRDFTGFLWRDLPGSLMPPAPAAVTAVQRLPSTGHWDIALRLTAGGVLHLLAFSATPPAFDGPEDRNGRRNHDEAAFWLAYLDGKLPMAPPAGPLVLLGKASLDPADGGGRPAALRALLTHPRLADPAPRGTAARVEPGHKGDPTLDTALYGGDLGGLRVDYVLPSRDLALTDSGILWPPATDPFAATLTAASRHAPVWVDLALP